MQYVGLAARFLIGAVFLVSALTKLTSGVRYRSFVRATGRMRVVPRKLVSVAAIAVVTCEAAIVVLLAVPVDIVAAAGLVLAFLLLAAFTVGIVVAVKDGQTEPCACFGKSTTPIGKQHAFRNGFLMLAAALGAAGILTGGTVQFGLAAVAALGGLVFGGLVTMFDDLYELFAPAPSPARRS